MHIRQFVANSIHLNCANHFIQPGLPQLENQFLCYYDPKHYSKLFAIISVKQNIRASKQGNFFALGWKNSLGHSQKRCERIPSPWTHPSHNAEISENILFSFTLAKWRRWTTLNWISWCINGRVSDSFQTKLLFFLRYLDA